ncbi:MAG: hypothetical protein ABIR83_06385 [Nakamurella sp.]
MHTAGAAHVIPPAATIAFRSPTRDASAPAGMSATSWPIPAIATTSAARAGLAPSRVAVITTTGAIGPDRWMTTRAARRR